MYTDHKKIAQFHPLTEPEFTQPLCTRSIKEIFSSCSDFEMRQIDLGLENKISVNVCWLDGTVLGTEISASVHPEPGSNSQ